MMPPSDPGIAPGASQSRRRRRAGGDAGGDASNGGRGRMTQENVPPPPPPPPPPPRNGAPPQQEQPKHDGTPNASLDSSIASSVRKDADAIMSSVHGGRGGVAGGAMAAPPAHHVSSSSGSAGAPAPAGAGVTDANSQGSASVASSSIKQPLHISAAASPDQLPRVARKQNRHRHAGIGAAPSSAVSEPPLGLADRSVFTHATMSDGPESGGSSGGKMSRGAHSGAGKGGGRGMSSDPFYIAPTRELLLSQYMVGDKQYQDFLLYGKGYKDDNLPGYDCGGVRLTPRSAAKMCAGWSAVGMIFMLWAGLMIQCQPLYLKGIDYNSGFVKRGGGSSSGAADYNANGNYAGEQVQNQQQANEQYNSYAGQGSGSGRRPIRPQASNAFKAAAAYFVSMVFSLICYHNHEQMGDLTTTMLPRWRVLLNVRQNCIVAYHQYRRRHYTDIPDTPSKIAGGRRRRRKKKGGDDGELPLFQSASSETTRRRRVGGGGGGPGSGSGSGFSGADDGDDRDVGSLPLYSPSGGNHISNAAENFTRELWNKVKGGMRSPLSRRRGRDTKTKHV